MSLANVDEKQWKERNENENLGENVTKILYLSSKKNEKLSSSSTSKLTSNPAPHSNGDLVGRSKNPQSKVATTHLQVPFTSKDLTVIRGREQSHSQQDLNLRNMPTRTRVVTSAKGHPSAFGLVHRKFQRFGTLRIMKEPTGPEFFDRV